MAAQKTQRQRMPEFRSAAEEAAFWNTHSPLDFPEDVEEAEVTVARPLDHILAIRLDAATIARLGKIGRKKGLGASTLARMWIMERLSELEAQEQENH